MSSIITLLSGLLVAFGAMIFMFQSRHHGIDNHERILEDKYQQLSETDDIKLQEILIVRKCYNAALLAFVFLMVQEIILIITIIAFAIWYERIIPLKFAILFIPGMIAFCFHIFGDLLRAFKTQEKSRAWLIIDRNDRNLLNQETMESNDKELSNPHATQET